MAARDGHDRRARRRRLRLSTPHAELVGLVERLPLTTWAGTAYRHLAPKYSPLSGQGALVVGGRWNPPGSFATLYLGLTRGAVVAEFQRLADRQRLSVRSFLPRTLYEYAAEFHALLDLRDPEARAALRLRDHDLSAVPPDRCQQIGEAAFACGREGILAPSATGQDDVLAIYLQNRQPGARLDPTPIEHWPASED